MVYLDNFEIRNMTFIYTANVEHNSTAKPVLKDI